MLIFGMKDVKSLDEAKVRNLTEKAAKSRNFVETQALPSYHLQQSFIPLGSIAKSSNGFMLLRLLQTIGAGRLKMENLFQ